MRTTAPFGGYRGHFHPAQSRRAPGQIRRDMIEQVAKVVIPPEMLDENTKYYVNPTGRFVKGGPAADAA